MKVASLKTVPSTSIVFVSVPAGELRSAGTVMDALAGLSH